MSQLLILSGAYCTQELVSEFGAIPPAFLPVGGKRLYQLQIEAFPDAQAWLSIPASFELGELDTAELRARDIHILRTDDECTLGEAFISCATRLNPGPTHILYGDTFVPRDEVAGISGNVLAAAVSDEEYPWHYLKPEIAGARELVLTGYFHVTDVKLLLAAVVSARCKFIEGLYYFHREYGWDTNEKISWLDFGHVHTYFQSKATISTARSFNQLKASRRTAVKLSSDSHKINCEASWFENIPPAVRPYTATYAGRVQDGERSGYRTEFLYLNTLADLYVFGRLTEAAWGMVFDGCCEFLNVAAGQPAALDQGAHALYLDKTQKRLAQFANASNFEVDRPCMLNGLSMPSLVEVAERSAQAIAAETSQPALVHGDLCFSNVFFDFRARNIKVIDPRGAGGNGDPTLYGDQRYDVAKLHHSVIGGYDFIVSGRYQLGGSGNRFDLELPLSAVHPIQRRFKELKAGRIEFGSSEIHAISIQLFLSMLPLHSDRPDRQRAFIANALRLFAELEA